VHERSRQRRSVCALLTVSVAATSGGAFRDSAGQVAWLTSSVSPRIASLLPSATESVCALGASDDLVGVSHECDFPPSVTSRPVLTRARLRPVRSSRETDAEVRSILRDALAVYDVDLDRLREVCPDVIVTQNLCDVCAVSLDDVRAAVARLGLDGVALAAGTTMVTEPAPTLSSETLRSLDPDVLLVKPCGFSLERTLEEVALLRKNLPWDRWSCVHDGRVFVCDGNAYFNRPGPRIVESLEILAACAHPSTFPDLRCSDVCLLGDMQQSVLLRWQVTDGGLTPLNSVNPDPSVGLPPVDIGGLL